MNNNQNINSIKFLSFTIAFFITLYSCNDLVELNYKATIINKSKINQYYKINSWLAYKVIPNNNKHNIDSNILVNILLLSKTADYINISNSKLANFKRYDPFYNSPVFLELKPNQSIDFKLKLKDHNYTNSILKEKYNVFCSLIYTEDNIFDSSFTIISNLNEYNIELTNTSFNFIPSFQKEEKNYEISEKSISLNFKNKIIEFIKI